MVDFSAEIPAHMGKSADHHDHEQFETSKSFVENPEIKDDLISDLPENVLCHILSFLPTKYAVGTSILSSKWKNLFPLIPNLELEFDDSLLLHTNSSEGEDVAAEIQPKEEHESSFVDFVGGVLKRLLQNGVSIHGFDLKCKRLYSDGRIASWLETAVMLRVQSVCLNASMRSSGKVIGTLNGCTSLVELYLIKCPLNVPTCRVSQFETVGALLY